jgi:hypothetical protein
VISSHPYHPDDLLEAMVDYIIERAERSKT